MARAAGRTRRRPVKLRIWPAALGAHGLQVESFYCWIAGRQWRIVVLPRQAATLYPDLRPRASARILPAQLGALFPA